MSANESVYWIGSVSRITGIGAETLRAWERRYEAVTPCRTDSGDRQYSREDVAKLLLLKTLVDAGISIGSIAGLTTDELKTRVDSDSILSNTRANSYAKDKSFEGTGCRVALLGDGFPLRILDSLPEVNGIELVGTLEHWNI